MYLEVYQREIDNNWKCTVFDQEGEEIAAGVFGPTLDDYNDACEWGYDLMLSYCDPLPAADPPG